MCPSRDDAFEKSVQCACGARRRAQQAVCEASQRRRACDVQPPQHRHHHLHALCYTRHPPRALSERRQGHRRRSRHLGVELFIAGIPKGIAQCARNGCGKGVERCDCPQRMRRVPHGLPGPVPVGGRSRNDALGPRHGRAAHFVAGGCTAIAVPVQQQRDLLECEGYCGQVMPSKARLPISCRAQHRRSCQCPARAAHALARSSSALEPTCRSHG
mmetsp:Transcript_8717/g.35555  ORF Transcript_8717/g.35555 Transcript_8717/m.35555 type:complete len:215 (-) Transcript_8717:1009-1653(-)